MKKSEFNQITTEVLVSTGRFQRFYMKANVDATRAARLAAKNQVAVKQVAFVWADDKFIAASGADTSEMVMPINQLQQYANTLTLASERYTEVRELNRIANEKALEASRAHSAQRDSDEALITELMPALREMLKDVGFVSRLHNGKISIEVRGCNLEAMLEKLVK